MIDGIHVLPPTNYHEVKLKLGGASVVRVLEEIFYVVATHQEWKLLVQLTLVNPILVYKDGIEVCSRDVMHV